eukprot:scaffold35916_cov68-Phaeocystis_antarctica.AAC.6
MIPTSLRPELVTANCAAAKAPVLKLSEKVMRSPSRVMVPIVEWIFTKEPCRACVLGMRVKAWTKRWTDPPLSLRTSMYLSSSHAESGRRESIANSWSAEAVAMARFEVRSRKVPSLATVVLAESTWSGFPVAGSVSLPLVTLTSLERNTMAAVRPAFRQTTRRITTPIAIAAFVARRRVFFSFT